MVSDGSGVDEARSIRAPPGEDRHLVVVGGRDPRRRICVLLADQHHLGPRAHLEEGAVVRSPKPLHDFYRSHTPSFIAMPLTVMQSVLGLVPQLRHPGL